MASCSGIKSKIRYVVGVDTNLIEEYRAIGVGKMTTRIVD